jgi:hypothetical protein
MLSRRFSVVAAAALMAAGIGATAISGAHAATAAPRVFSPPPLLHAHSHNDENATNPLQDALASQFDSVEADVILQNDVVRVGHDDADIIPNQTLESLYLDPLTQRVRDNGGSVYDGWHVPFTLVIELKDETGTNTLPTNCKDEAGEEYFNGKLYQRVHDLLETEYSGMLSSYDNGVVSEGAVKIVFTGQTPRNCVQTNDPRHEFFDAGEGDLTTYSSAENPITTAQWSSVSSDLADFVTTAHEHGRQVRIWDTPQDDQTWQEELDDGVDFLNTDLNRYPNNLADFLTPIDDQYGWVAATGAGSFANVVDVDGLAIARGTLYDTLADGVCAHVAVTLYRTDGSADPVYRQYHCGAYTDLGWTVTGSENAIDYSYAEITVFRDAGPSTSEDLYF